MVIQVENVVCSKEVHSVFVNILNLIKDLDELSCFVEMKLNKWCGWK